MKKPWKLAAAGIVLALGLIAVIWVVRAGRKPSPPPPKNVLTYDMVAQDVLAHVPPPGPETEPAEEGSKGLNYLLQQYLHKRVKVEGWVTSVESDEGGGRTVKIDVDAPGGKSDGPEVTVFVTPESATDQAPAVGSKVSFQGGISGLQADNGRLLMELRVAGATPAAGRPRAAKPAK